MNTINNTDSEQGEKDFNLKNSGSINDAQIEVSTKLSSTRCNNMTDTEESDSRNKIWITSSINQSKTEENVHVQGLKNSPHNDNVQLESRKEILKDNENEIKKV